MEFYYNIFSLPDEQRPPKHVIESDLRLDAWVKKRSAEIAKQRQESSKQDVMHYYSDEEDDEIIPR